MSLRNPNIVPPQDWEVVGEVVTLLQASDAVTNGALESANIYENRHPADPKPDRYAVVRLGTVIGGEVESTTHHSRAMIQVEAVARRDVSNPERFLSQVHADFYAALVDQSLSLTKAGFRLGLTRLYRPTPASLDVDKDEYYSTATYLAVLDPL